VETGSKGNIARARLVVRREHAKLYGESGLNPF